MSDSETKRPPRLAGTPLLLAARLIEAPGSGAVLYRVATRQLGLTRLAEIDIAGDVVPYRALHLGAARAISEEK